jgi:hypothetical protein
LSALNDCWDEEEEDADNEDMDMDIIDRCKRGFLMIVYFLLLAHTFLVCEENILLNKEPWI